ncbi:MAG: DNA-binding protein [Bacteroidetes bacterium RIFOXYA12_FULL_35_11]|nr:MAG: DNA-binding protein [Bacteroidetes bacterium GWF2_35_48]OFY73667.1 MAG: DNA-binding protein [Bacteroidetes bacterium RIFOXYA12_FULL_35_11]OFY97339.1 MAG: DNA-binding protein [Bacteroidetes bacterium RIFOXYC12_FULL_35_7]HBX51196.1 DNA-binding protein [Bacteroidales bacterium]
MEEFEKKEKDEIFSKAVRAGKRTYFFDVKSTKKGEYYLTITESKKNFDRDGNYHYEKHKIFLYKEDFEKFEEGLNEVMKYISETNPDIPSNPPFGDTDKEEN